MDYLTKNMPNGILYGVVQNHKSIELTAEENSVCVIYRLDTYYKNTNHLLWEHKYTITDGNGNASNETIRRETFLSSTKTGDSFDDPYWSTNKNFPTVEMSMPTNADTGFEHGEFKTNTTFVGYRFTWKNPVDGKTVKLSFQSRFGRNTPPRGEDYVDPDYETATPVNDSYSVIQGELLSFSKDNIVVNDLAGESQIADVEIRQIVNCQLQRTGDSFVLTPDADIRYGSDKYPYFTYKLVDKNGIFSRKTGLVSVSIEMLPEVKAVVCTSSEIGDLINNYTPPTLADIFNTWGRVSTQGWFPPGTTPKGEAAAWEMMGADQFRCTVNSADYTGFISPEKFTHYTHTVNMSSTSTDDDWIGIILAFKESNQFSKVKILVAQVNTGGRAQTPFTVTTVIVNPANGRLNRVTHLFKSTNYTKYPSHRNGTITGDYNQKVNTGWRDLLKPVKLKAQRSGNIFTVQVAPFDSDNLSEGDIARININDYPALSWAADALPYGYICYSQQYSTYTDVEFSGSGAMDTSRIYEITTGSVYEYINGTWSVIGKIWDVLGYPRYLTDSQAGTRYLVENGSVTKVS